MKLSYKRVILVGFAFFLISAFWQAYDTIVPLLLVNRFEMSQATSGGVMALDNIFAVLLLPFFGRLSDRTKTRFGRRTPYIFFGTLAAAAFFAALGYASTLPTFILLLLGSLLSMATFRSPAVALMPDVTVKPLRSKGNAVINLMGAAGGMLVLLLATGMHISARETPDYSDYLLLVAALMLVSLLIFLFTVKEPRWAAEMEEETKRLGGDAEGEARTAAGGKLTREQRVSLILLLASVALWYIGYNAVTSKYSLYATNVLQMNYSTTLLLAQAAAIVCYLPVGVVASRLGRRKTILIGILLLTGAFTGAYFVTPTTPPVLMTVVFALAGVGWATINVNSFPMVVELAKEGDVGKYTGYYYAASMAAQVITPILSGSLMDRFGMQPVLFPYAAIATALAFFTMLFVRHGDAKPIAKRGLEGLDVDVD